MKSLKRFILFLTFLVLNGAGIALSLKANVGLMPIDALSNTLSELTSIKVGTCAMITNIVFAILEVIVLARDYKPYQILKVTTGVIIGLVTNFLYYDVFNFELHSYFIRFIVFILSTILMALTVGGVMSLNVLTYPIEGFSRAMDLKTKFSFSQVRYFIDFLFVGVSIILTLIFSLNLNIREGTIVASLIFTPIMTFFINLFDKMFKRNGLI